MIRSIFIKDFALVEEARVEFTPGLNIITGETGAGKSIIVNALAQLCGERGNVDLVRAGSRKAIIEAAIDYRGNPAVEQLLTSFEIDPEGFEGIIIRKEINSKGSSRIFINDSPVTLTSLNQISGLLIDLHGQHQHQRLLHPQNHISYLDEFARLNEDVAGFRRLLGQFKKAAASLNDLRDSQLKAFQLQDMYRYQDAELDKAQLDAGEMEQLKAEMKVLENIELFHQYGSSLTQNLYSGEINASQLIAEAAQNLSKLADLDGHFAVLRENIHEALATIEEIGRSTEEYLAGLQFDPERLEAIHARIAQLDFLLKKYQKLNVAELIEFHKEIEEKLGDIDQYDERIAEGEQEVARLRREVIQAGRELSLRREKSAREFEARIDEILAKIGMQNARLKVNQSLMLSDNGAFTVGDQKVNSDENGFDRIFFEISSNVGEPFRPIHKIASGGEISRIMLALKTVFAESDRTPSLIFDEIDSGISGKVAQTVGLKLNELARFHQILCVTHLPQIAAQGDSHYRVFKQVHNGRTNVRILPLSEQDRVQEIAVLLGGQTVSSQAIENARHLLEESKPNKKAHK